MRYTLAKLTSKNQLTLPKRVVAALDYPSHFEVVVNRGALILWPGHIVAIERQGELAGIPPDVLREARRIIAERKTESAHVALAYGPKIG